MSARLSFEKMLAVQSPVPFGCRHDGKRTPTQITQGVRFGSSLKSPQHEVCMGISCGCRQRFSEANLDMGSLADDCGPWELCRCCYCWSSSCHRFERGAFCEGCTSNFGVVVL